MKESHLIIIQKYRYSSSEKLKFISKILFLLIKMTTKEKIITSPLFEEYVFC